MSFRVRIFPDAAFARCYATREPGSGIWLGLAWLGLVLVWLRDLVWLGLVWLQSGLFGRAASGGGRVS